MIYEEAIKWMKDGDHVYSDIKDPTIGYLGAPSFGSKLGPGVFAKLKEKGIIMVGMIIDGVIEYDLVKENL